MSDLPSVPPEGGYDFQRCFRCGWLDRTDFFWETTRRSRGLAACRKCGFSTSEEPKLVTKEERERVASGFYDNYTEL